MCVYLLLLLSVLICHLFPGVWFPSLCRAAASPDALLCIYEASKHGDKNHIGWKNGYGSRVAEFHCLFMARNKKTMCEVEAIRDGRVEGWMVRLCVCVCVREPSRLKGGKKTCSFLERRHSCCCSTRLVTIGGNAAAWTACGFVAAAQLCQAPPPASLVLANRLTQQITAWLERSTVGNKKNKRWKPQATLFLPSRHVNQCVGGAFHRSWSAAAPPCWLLYVTIAELRPIYFAARTVGC